jgi:hypothetical protein
MSASNNLQCKVYGGLNKKLIRAVWGRLTLANAFHLLDVTGSLSGIFVDDGLLNSASFGLIRGGAMSIFVHQSNSHEPAETNRL